MVNTLIKKVNDINNINDHGCTPLNISCHKGCISLINCLINNGADVNKEDGNGALPLIIACKNENKEIVKILIEHGADVNIKNKYFETPLTIACSLDSLPIIQLLIENGADINIIGLNGTTPLTLACKNENLSIIKYLINNDADTNMKDKNNNTPLGIACANENDSIIHTLIEHGAYLNIGLSDHKTPLTILYKKNKESLIKNYFNNNQSYIINFLINHFCTIKIDNYQEMGCFIKLNISSLTKQIHGVLSINHFLPLNYFNSNTNDNTSLKINIKWFNKTFSVSNSNFIFSSELLDVIFIELDEEIVKELEPYFLELSFYINEVNNRIYYLKYTKNRETHSNLNRSIIDLLNRYKYRQSMSYDQLCLWYSNFYKKIYLDDHQMIDEKINSLSGFNFVFASQEQISEPQLSPSNQTNNSLSNDSLSNDSLSNDSLSNDSLSNDSLSNDSLSNDSQSTSAHNYDTNYIIKPIFNEHLNITGFYTYKNLNMNMVLESKIITLAINNLYNPNNFIKARLPAKILSPQEIEELKNHGLEETTSPYIFISPASATVTALLFYRTNHSWYWTPTIPSDYSWNEIKKLNWSIIDESQPIIAIGGRWNGMSPASRNVTLIQWIISTQLKYLQ